MAEIDSSIVSVKVAAVKAKEVTFLSLLHLAREYGGVSHYKEGK